MQTFQEFLGSPKLYHGSARKFKKGKVEPSRRGSLGPGVYLTPDKSLAKMYGQNIYKFGFNGKILNVHALDQGKRMWHDDSDNNWEAAQAYAKQNGYIGIFAIISAKPPVEPTFVTSPEQLHALNKKFREVQAVVFDPKDLA